MQELCNSKVARYQTIKKIRILPTVFSVDGGELTPTPQSEAQHREREVRERDRGVLRGGPAGRRVRPGVMA